MKQFTEALADSDHKMKKADSQVILLAEQLDSTKTRICHVAKDSQNNKALSESLIQRYRVQNSEKETEQKKLLLEKIRCMKRLGEAEERYRQYFVFSSPNVQLSKQLAMENLACQTQIERNTDIDVSTRRSLVENIVFTSHIK